MCSLHTTHLNIFKILFVCVCVCMCEYVCLFTEKVQGIGMLIAAGALEMDFIKSVLSRPSLSKEPCGRCKQNESSIKHSQQEHEVRSAFPKLCWFKRLCLTRARRGAARRQNHPIPKVFSAKTLRPFTKQNANLYLHLYFPKCLTHKPAPVCVWVFFLPCHCWRVCDLFPGRSPGVPRQTSELCSGERGANCRLIGGIPRHA